jgi:DNA-binding NarL/FixJ family response regulator
MIKVLIADSQALTRQGVIAVLAAVKDIEILDQADNIAGLKQLVSAHKPDVIITDHFEIDGIKTLAELFDLSHVLVLSNKQQKQEIQQVIDLGIKNYVSKECRQDELINAIYAAAVGKQFFCEGILSRLDDSATTDKSADTINSLSTRETEIIHLVAEGLTNKEIAEKLFLSIHTVKTHRKNIIKKLGFSFKNAAELISLTRTN